MHTAEGMEMITMWGIFMIWASGSLGAPLTSRNVNISVDCKWTEVMSSHQKLAPTPLADLKASVSVGDKWNVLDISWAITIDSTIKDVEGFEIYILQDIFKCEYNPSLAEAMNRSLIPKDKEQIWFNYRIEVFHANYYVINACNLPLLPAENGKVFKSTKVWTPRESTAPPTTPTVTVAPDITTQVPGKGGRSLLLVPVGIIVGLALLLFGYITYRTVSASLTAGFQRLATGPKVPVLVVYPAESVEFQGAVVALAEFLQQHGGCSVEIDIWQQGSVAKLGPMRWLLEQVQTAHRVIIVAPQPSSQPSPQKLPFPGVSAPPAAAQDLYLLVLNLVAAQAMNGAQLAKFWVVRFGETGPLTSELQVCRTFSLMKDLKKLCRSLRSQRYTQIADLLTRSSDWCGRNDSEKLRAAVQALRGLPTHDIAAP
uniref:SEFIR domain-containing protein n=1 Tax=Neogobius melanostomus TaxID=47308 RepID=A0A8C6WNR5_9GOBI